MRCQQSLVNFLAVLAEAVLRDRGDHKSSSVDNAWRPMGEGTVRLGTENRLHEDISLYLFDLAVVSYLNDSLRADPRHSFRANRKHLGCEVFG